MDGLQGLGSWGGFLNELAFYTKTNHDFIKGPPIQGPGPQPWWLRKGIGKFEAVSKRFTALSGSSLLDGTGGSGCAKDLPAKKS